MSMKNIKEQRNFCGLIVRIWLDSLEKFKESVECFVKELEHKKAYLLYGCINNIFVETGKWHKTNRVSIMFSEL